MWNQSLLTKNIINVRTLWIYYFIKNFREYVPLYKLNANKMIAILVNINFTDKSLLSCSTAFISRQLTQFSFYILVCILSSLPLIFFFLILIYI